MNKESKSGIYVLMSSEYNLDLYIPQKKKDLKNFLFVSEQKYCFWVNLVHKISNCQFSLKYCT